MEVLEPPLPTHLTHKHRVPVPDAGMGNTVPVLVSLRSGGKTPRPVVRSIIKKCRAHWECLVGKNWGFCFLKNCH